MKFENLFLYSQPTMDEEMKLDESQIQTTAPIFAMGIGPPSRNGRHRRYGGNRHSRSHPRIRNKKVKSTKSGQSWIWPPPFPLSRNKFYGFRIQFTLCGFPQSSVKAVQYFHKLIAPPSPTCSTPECFRMTPQDIKELYDAFYENIQARWAFRRLVIAFKLRKCKLMNETDPITLEDFTQPIDIITFQTKSIHRFEAKSIAKAWRRNLLNHDGVFPEPRMPTNPLTNLSFSLFQIHSVCKQLQAKGQMDWVLDSFRSCGYDLERWQQKYGSTLKIESLESILKDTNSYDRFDMLMDFAELQFEYHGVDFQKCLFKWIFTSTQASEYADLWLRACRRFYIEKYTTTEKEDIEDLEMRTSIINAYLVEVPSIVKVLYSRYLEKQRDGRSRIQNRVILRPGNSIV